MKYSVVNGQKTCTKCDRTLPVEDFGTRRSRNVTQGYRSYCKKCATKKVQEYKATLPEDVRKYKQREVSLRFRFDMSFEDLFKMFSQQHGKCAICERVLDFLTYGKDWVVDHKHQPGEGRHPHHCKPRGLLCYRCNTALGNFQDSTSVLMAAINYLENA